MEAIYQDLILRVYGIFDIIDSRVILITVLKTFKKKNIKWSAWRQAQSIENNVCPNIYVKFTPALLLT